MEKNFRGEPIPRPSTVFAVEFYMYYKNSLVKTFCSSEKRTARKELYEFNNLSFRSHSVLIIVFTIPNSFSRQCLIQTDILPFQHGNYTVDGDL